MGTSWNLKDVKAAKEILYELLDDDVFLERMQEYIFTHFTDNDIDMESVAADRFISVVQTFLKKLRHSILKQ